MRLMTPIQFVGAPQIAPVVRAHCAETEEEDYQSFAAILGAQDTASSKSVRDGKDALDVRKMKQAEGTQFPALWEQEFEQEARNDGVPGMIVPTADHGNQLLAQRPGLTTEKRSTIAEQKGKLEHLLDSAEAPLAPGKDADARAAAQNLEPCSKFDKEPAVAPIVNAQAALNANAGEDIRRVAPAQPGLTGPQLASAVQAMEQNLLTVKGSRISKIPVASYVNGIDPENISLRVSVRAEAEPSNKPALVLDARSQQFVDAFNQSMAISRKFEQPKLSGYDSSSAHAAAIALIERPAFRPTALTAIPAFFPKAPLSITNPNWSHAFSNQVSQFVRPQDKTPQIAELRLDPPELGPIRVSITTVNGVAHAAFASAHASVRQMIEQALPQLAQSMSQVGIELGQTDVGDHRPDRWSEFAEKKQGRGGSSELSEAQAGIAIDAEVRPRAATMSSQGIVRTYA